MEQQREIKFRAWNGEEMIYPSLEGHGILSSGEILKRFTNAVQYTGLKDKAGKEIYEGDICRVAHNGLCEIFWDVKRARFGVKWLDKTYRSIRGEVEMIFNNHEITFEVIGNIYENQEIIQKSKQ